MSYAPDYTPTTSFADEETNQASGRSTVSTAKLDVELANVASSFNELNANVQKVLRDDDKLKDFLVEPYALAEQTRAMMAATGRTPKGAWTINTDYEVGDLVQRNAVAYMCQIAHNSGPAFNVGFWIAISGDGSAAVSAEQAAADAAAAATSASAASTSATNAAASASSASTSATNAAASQLAAQNAANSIAGLAPINLSAYMLDLLANNNASGALDDLGVSAFVQTLLNDADAATARATLGIAAATTLASGLTRLTTDAEAQAGTSSALAVTPAAFRAANIMSGTAQASTSGTSIDFTGIPSWVKRITVLLNGVSTNGTSAHIVQLGDSGGYETSGYVGSSGSTLFTSGFIFANPGLASAVVHGQVTLCRLTGNTWSAFGGVALSSTAAQGTHAGTKTLSDTLDRLRITTAGGTDTFDAGQINILYE